MITDIHCNTCGVAMHKNRLYVMVKNDLWKQVCDYYEIPQNLCICKNCIEKALGRKLEAKDYYDGEEPIYLNSDGTISKG